MIERSPIGALPSTPAYQDALGRLYASHQAYPSADHHDGHVTARSLAGLSNFHAGNLTALREGAIAADALEPNSSIFDRYVRSLPSALRPKAEAYRTLAVGRPVHHRAKLIGTVKAAVARDPMHTLFLVPGSGPHPGLPGNYLHGSVFEIGADGAHHSYAVQIHDRDDGSASAEAASLQAAIDKLLEVLESAPFNMNELEVLGFNIS